MMRLTWPLLLVLFGCPDALDTDPLERDGQDTQNDLVDADQDGFTEDVDCDDQDAAVHPDADELCNEIDDNCNELVDDDDPWLIEGDVFYADGDGDGYGEDGDTITACVMPDGYVTDNTDCNDNDRDYNPGADEDDCTDPNDYNCDGSVMFADADGDGFAACEDCNDSDEAINDDAAEVCDGIDNDCDKLTDDDDDSVADQQVFYADADEDGYGDATSLVTVCEMPDGYVTDTSDCDDDDSNVNPAATELCDGIDNDCDSDVDDDDSSLADGSTFYRDADEDGFGNENLDRYACTQPSGYVVDNTDCNDGYADAYPGAEEICDGQDNDCDALTDDDDDDVSGLLEWFLDADEDGYGDGTLKGLEACAAPSGYVADGEDCDDDNPLANPSIDFDFEDLVDNDCDANTDEDVGFETYTHDGDIQDIWDNNCTSCHSDSSASGDLSMEDAFSLLVGVPSADLASMDLVTPGDLDNSYLWRKIEGSHLAAGGAGSQMPTSGSLSSDDEEAIETWILEGAVQ